MNWLIIILVLTDLPFLFCSSAYARDSRPPGAPLPIQVLRQLCSDRAFFTDRTSTVYWLLLVWDSSLSQAGHSRSVPCLTFNFFYRVHAISLIHHSWFTHDFVSALSGRWRNSGRSRLEAAWAIRQDTRCLAFSGRLSKLDDFCFEQLHTGEGSIISTPQVLFLFVLLFSLMLLYYECTCTWMYTVQYNTIILYYSRVL